MVTKGIISHRVDSNKENTQKQNKKRNKEISVFNFDTNFLAVMRMILLVARLSFKFNNSKHMEKNTK